MQIFDCIDLYLFKASTVVDAEGDVTVLYETPPELFRGNLQPSGGGREGYPFGERAGYSMVVFTDADLDFSELDGVGTGGVEPEYRISAVDRWTGHTELELTAMVEAG